MELQKTGASALGCVPLQADTTKIKWPCSVFHFRKPVKQPGAFCNYATFQNLSPMKYWSRQKALLIWINCRNTHFLLSCYYVTYKWALPFFFLAAFFATRNCFLLLLARQQLCSHLHITYMHLALPSTFPQHGGSSSTFLLLFKPQYFVFILQKSSLCYGAPGTVILTKRAYFSVILLKWCNMKYTRLRSAQMMNTERVIDFQLKDNLNKDYLNQTEVKHTV